MGTYRAHSKLDSRVDPLPEEYCYDTPIKANERKIRKCLRCGKDFKSEHKTNRLCERCVYHNQQLADPWKDKDYVVDLS